CAVLIDLAVALGRVDHRNADAVFDRPEWVKALRLGGHRCSGVADDTAQSDKRRVADALSNVVVDFAAERLGKGHGVLCSESTFRARSVSDGANPPSLTLRALNDTNHFSIGARIRLPYSVQLPS